MNCNDCKTTGLVDAIREDIRDIKADIRTLLTFRTKIMVGAGLLGTALSFAISIMIKMWR